MHVRDQLVDHRSGLRRGWMVGAVQLEIEVGMS